MEKHDIEHMTDEAKSALFERLVIERFGNKTGFAAHFGLRKQTVYTWVTPQKWALVAMLDWEDSRRAVAAVRSLREAVAWKP